MVEAEEVVEAMQEASLYKLTSSICDDCSQTGNTCMLQSSEPRCLMLEEFAPIDAAAAADDDDDGDEHFTQRTMSETLELANTETEIPSRLSPSETCSFNCRTSNSLQRLEFSTYLC